MVGRPDFSLVYPMGCVTVSHGIHFNYQQETQTKENTMANTKPRTCCTTHNDTCRFGRDHAFAGPFLLGKGEWSHEDDVKCGICDGVCYGDRPLADLPAEHVEVVAP